MLGKLKCFLSLILVGAIFSLSFSSFSVHAASDDETKTVKVGYYQNEVFEDGGYEGAIKKGYAYEYYRKISEYAGWTYEYGYGDFVDIYNMLLKGEVDVVAGLAYTEKRSSLIYYPEKPMGFESYGLVKHEGDDSLTSDPATLNGRTIGVLDSAIVDILNAYLKKERVNAEVITFSDYGNLLECFDRKEIDLIAAEIDGIYDRYHAEVMSYFGENDYYMCVSRKRPDLVRALNMAQAQLYVDNPDYISNLRNKYYPSALSSRAFNKTELKWLKEHEELTIGYLNDFLPYSDTDKNGNVTGMVADIFPYTFKQLGISSLTYEYKGYDTYDELIAAIGSGQVDVAFPVGGGLYYSEEDGILISEPVLSTLTDLVYSEKRPSTGTVDFAVNEKNKLQYYYIKNNYPHSSIKQYASLEDCLDAVEKGDVSYTTLNGLRTGLVLKNKSYDKLSFIQLSYQDDSCFGVKIGNNGLLMLLNRGIHIAGSDYQNMAFRYSQNLDKPTLKDFLKKYYWFIFAAILIFLLFIMHMLIKDIRIGRERIAEKERARIEIEKANRDKFVFVNKMANYMGEPLRGLNSLIHKAKITEDSNKVSNYIEEMEIYSSKLSEVINNILNMSRLESGQFKLEDKNQTFKGKRILVVEDTMQNQMVSGKILKKLGFEIQCASDGEEAYDKLNAAPEGYFDAIIMDMDVRGNDDFEAATKIRSLNNYAKADIPIVAITSEVPVNDEGTENKLFTEYYFTKPYDIAEMTEVFSKIFKS